MYAVSCHRDPAERPPPRAASSRARAERYRHDVQPPARQLADGAHHMTPSAQNAGGGRRVTRWTRELIIDQDPRVERPVRRAAVLGRLEPVAGPLARPGVACRALPRGGLALHQRRQAPVRGQLRRGRARGRPGAPQARAAPPPARRGAPRRSSAATTAGRACRATWPTSCWPPTSGRGSPRRTPPRWSAGWPPRSAGPSGPRTRWATRAAARAVRASRPAGPAARASARG